MRSMPENAQSVVDIWPAAMRDGLLAAERAVRPRCPRERPRLSRVNEKDRAWVDAQCPPQPIRRFLKKLTLNGAREGVSKKSYIRATGVAIPYFDAGLASARQKGWRTGSAKDELIKLATRLIVMASHLGRRRRLPADGRC
jgi:hypothetical protein